MRDYAVISSQFWTGTTGKELRGLGAEAQLVAVYLLTCPNSNMIGMYYLPLPTLCHETGLSAEGAAEALRRVCSTDFAHYDQASEYVFVPNMAGWQIGWRLEPRDKRRQGVVNELLRNGKCPFALEFWNLYNEPYGLAELMDSPKVPDSPS